jgi:hypothetical protein
MNHAHRPHGRSRTALAVLALAFTAISLAGEASDTLHVGFSAPGPNGLPDGWDELTFRNIQRHTRYQVIDTGGAYEVKAEAEASASGLIHPLDLDTSRYRTLQWRWKVERLLDKADIRTRQGDDYPARIYVTFAYDPGRASLGQRIKYETVRLLYGEYPPHAGLNYVWDGKAALGTIVPNAFTDRVRMVVVESGPTRLGQWLSYQRDIYADYRQAFGEEPPHISGVAIMTDTDGTGESAVAYYGDISIGVTDPR